MQVRELGNGNKIYVGANVTLNAKNIVFAKTAKNNIAYLEGNLNLGESVIKFNGGGSVVFLSASKHPYFLRASVYNNSALHFGKNNYINPSGDPMRIVLSEQKHVFFGSDCTFSFNIWIRLADPHLIYSIETKKRINPSKSVFIGDHVWFGQFATILKGTQIGSGSIVGADALVSGKKIPSNTIWAGNPARQVKEKIFWSGKCVHAWTDAQTKKYARLVTDKYTYAADDKTISFDEIDLRLTECKTAEEKLNYLLELSNNPAKNRFAI